MKYSEELEVKISRMIRDQPMGVYRVNEYFSTVQGEGFWQGVPSTFIRLQGCPVGCPWCDTKYTWPATAAQDKPLGTDMSIEEILQIIEFPHVVITGGEPTMWNLDNLIYALRHMNMGASCYVQVETAGLHAFKGNLIPDWVTWSPKANINFDAPEDFKIMVNEIKFVVDTQLEFWQVEKVLDWFRNYKPLNLMFNTLTFMAEGCPPTPDSLNRAMMFAREFNGYPERVMVSDRLQYRANVQ